MKNNYKFWIVFSLVIVFAAGVTGGILLDRHIISKKPKKLDRNRASVHFPTLNTMAQELNLTEKQKKQIREIFKQNEKKLRTLRGYIHEQYSSVRSQLKNEIKSILTEEQNKKFEAMIEKYISQRKKYSRKPRKDSRSGKKSDKGRRH